MKKLILLFGFLLLMSCHKERGYKQSIFYYANEDVFDVCTSYSIPDYGKIRFCNQCSETELDSVIKADSIEIFNRLRKYKIVQP
jgi:hypothetical protein